MGSFAVLLIFFSLSVSARADATQCERLFNELAELQTCESLRQLKGADISDAEMQELVMKQVHGVSTVEAETIRKQREEANRKAAEEIEARIQKTPCGRIYPPGFPRSVCRWYTAITPGARTDEDLRASVGEAINNMETDKALRDSVTTAIQRLEQDEVAEVRHQIEAEAEAEARRAEDEARLAKYKAQAEAVAEARTAEDEARRAEDEARRAGDEARRVKEEAEAKARREKDQRRRRVEDERWKAAEKRSAELRDAELGRGGIGLFLQNWSLQGFGVVLVARFLLQNNTEALTKDFVILCETAGESGTRLSVVRKTLYQALEPRERRSFELNMGLVNSQSAHASCRVAGWS